MLALKPGPQIAAKIGNPAGLLCRRIRYSEIWCARDNGIPSRSTPDNNYIVAFLVCANCETCCI